MMTLVVNESADSLVKWIKARIGMTIQYRDLPAIAEFYRHDLPANLLVLCALKGWILLDGADDAA